MTKARPQPRAYPALRVIENTLDEGSHELTFEEVYRKYARYVAAIALRLLGRPEDVDDAVHDTFLQVRRSLPRLRDQGALKGWLATITVRVTRRAIRRERMLQGIGVRSTVAVDSISATTLSQGDYELMHGAYMMLDRLSTNERIAWILRRVHGAQLATVADMCECSLATVKRRIAAADRKLKEWTG